ncbi:hypothetical protein ACHAXR_009390 [Thalassiosira sp. AJA248-18]
MVVVRRLVKALLLLILLLLHSGTSDQDEDPSTWDLYDSDTAERFFLSSEIEATFFIDDDSSTATPRVEWTATTPLPSACGVSIFVQSQDDDSYYWKHVFSDAMDPSVPSFDHVVSINLDEEMINHIIVDISSLDAMDDDAVLIMPEGDSTVAFRLFVFLPYGKGTLVSCMYALELPLCLLEDKEEEDSGVWTRRRLEEEDNDDVEEEEEEEEEEEYSGAISCSGVWTGRRLEESQANEEDPLSIYELNYAEWVSSIWGSGAPSEPEYTFPTLPAPLLLMDHYGESPLGFSRGPDFSGESSGKVTAILNDDNMIKFNLEGGDLQGEGVAASFHYGLDPPPDESETLSADGFYETVVVDEENGLRHGLVRAEEVSGEPYAVISPSSLPRAAWGDPSTTVVAGASWVDSQMNVQHSQERKTPLSSFDLPTQSPISSAVNDKVEDIASDTCQPGSMRNLALLSEGATILDVSSNYGTSPSAVSSSYGAEKAIDGFENTAWSSFGDGNDAFVTIELPFMSNVVYVDFHTRSMTDGTAQIYEYQVEFIAEDDDSAIAIVSKKCTLPDASRPYTCISGAMGVSVVTFRAVQSSGGNTGAMEIGVHGCSVDEKPVLAIEETSGTCTSDNDCTARVRSRFPLQSSSGVDLCQCYAASSTDPFDECEGEDDSTCKIARCTNTCAGFGANCTDSTDSDGGTKICELQPISGQDPLLAIEDTSGTCTSDNDCTARVRSRFPLQSSSGVDLCQCYAASSTDPFDECEGEDDSTCKIARCANTCAGLDASCTISTKSDDGTKMCELQPISSQDPLLDPGQDYIVSSKQSGIFSQEQVKFDDCSMGKKPTPGELVIMPAGDSYVTPRRKGLNFGDASTMYVDGRPGNIALMKFDVSCLESRSITSAMLKLYSIDGSPNGGMVHVLTSDEDSTWDEDKVTWNSAPSSYSKFIAQLKRVRHESWVSVDITDALVGNNVGNFLTIAINSNGSNRAVYGSKEGEHPPQLILTHEQAIIQPRVQELVSCLEPTVKSLQFPPVNNVIIKEAYGDTNFAHIPNLNARNVVGSRVDSLLKFAFYCAWSDLVVSRAVLKLYVKSGTPKGGKVVNVLGPWEEDKVTWNSAPLEPTSFSEVIGRVRTGRWVEIDVTSAMTSMQDYKVTFRIEGLHENAAVYGSTDDGAQAPILEIFF